MDWYDYCLKFSSELLVLGLTVAVAGLHLYFFGFDSHMYQDGSHAAKFLSYHMDFNPKLYAKEMSVSTVITTPRSFIAEASAEDLQSLQQDAALYTGSEDENGDNFNLVINDGAIVKPNPDSISGLIAKQIKVYETQDGDTLASLSQKFGISQQTIIWANNLPTTTIKPGWQLIILPVSGVLVKATSNDTLPDIAKKYSGNLDTIIAYNGLENAEDITDGQLVIVPGGTVPPPPAPPKPPVQKPGSSGQTNGSGVTPPKQVDNGTGHIFPWGYCTWYVATKVHVPWGGNANSWLINARAYGAVITQEPSVGTIVVTNENRRYGHVAYVEQVENGRFLVSEMNYEKFGKVDYRWISNNSSVVRGFIHP